MTISHSDQDLITRLQSSGRLQQQAYAQLLDLYQERVYWHIRRMVHLHDDADDILQNTFVKVWKGLDQFKGKSSLFTWIYRIATNEALSHLRKQSKRTIVSTDDEERHLHIASDPYFDGDEAQVLLKAAIAGLPDRQRAVFLMRYYDELSYAEIAEITQVSAGGLKASYHHAMTKIKNYLSTHGATR